MDIQEWKIKNQRRRKYSHFDSKVSLDRVWKYISNPNKVAVHGFYPFIHYTLSFLKYSKNGGVKKKTREICYSSHIDRFIYQYYGYRLNQYYNDKVKQYGIDDSAIAYRTNLHKNNIHFAKKAIDFIKNRTNCFVVIGDFTNFFDNLDHAYLKKMICDLLNADELPDDYYAVFKNITKYSTWDLKDLLELNGLENNYKGILEFNKLKVALPFTVFKDLKKVYLRPHKNDYGIPQGSAISAVLSNIYMLDFDKKISNFVAKKNGLYMRYSDDFIIILPKYNLDIFKDEFRFINSIVNSTPRLHLEPEKTQIFEFNKGEVRSCNESVLENTKNGKNLINYLGFTFDGKLVTLRDKTVSKYYYRLYRKLKTIIKSNGYTKKGKRISSKNVYLKYSIKGSNVGRGNFISYVKRAEYIFGNEQAIGHIAKRHMQKIRKRLNQIKH
ncbi:reverse transcriptase/maturase family protein [Paenibacillus polymyxa]|uniref:reverse transcriptase/maturase family protein n=1 Tax=Paenibacillus polymyxa TaxID=1406 RepID=UPI002023FDEB|nr:reverse transcriptase/maturase family protein [Paenibacillus polymyxa]MDU8672374.1 reverse transcriptase/maturase family protein [Paenibacillus polymyxa]MDU8697282.1 reverse transcriptase/maturase family protein [Paenibacillus polymyxa]URJ56458.1 reverse transcriptase/maturase family protein [Paenibacillus polymyxa]URJ63886.1 reverse transcriptase/maturase family protein [Paenibacillus polymyxa]URJ70967.1 reverse transcriptase/maturase family protein [Paenibacillus polymyxa]